MTIPFYCLVVTTLLPYLAKLPVMVAMHREGGYDNHHPRDQQARLSGWGRRALAAHANAFEILSVFSACVFINHLKHADAEPSAVISIVFVISRLFYHLFYLTDWSTLRSIVWFGGLICCFSLVFV